MANDNVNGSGVHPIIAGAHAVPVNPNVVQALTSLLDRARRGEIHSLVAVGVRGSDFASFDTIVVENTALAMIMQGAMLLASAKITKGAWDAQQVQTQPTILRPPPGMKV